jgi:CarD family transcriptional regulator
MNILSFSVGDKVVYPNHGVGVIEQISSRTIGSQVEKFYLLKIKASSLKVMVPFHNVNSVGLRKVVRNGEVQRILDFLTDGKCDNHADWKYRFKENSDKMRTGSLLDVAIVLKGLLLLAQAKSLSFREKKMLERARYLLVSELAMSKNWQEPDVEDLLNRALSKSKLRSRKHRAWRLESDALCREHCTSSACKPIRCNTRSTTTLAPIRTCKSSIRPDWRTCCVMEQPCLPAKSTRC